MRNRRNWRSLAPRCSTSSQGAHIIKTQAQTLDEALDIIAANRRRKPARKTKHIHQGVAEELGFGTTKTLPITLPKLDWMKSR